LIDRCLSPRLVVALQKFGYQAYRLGDLFGNDGQYVEDVTWIAEAGKRGLLALTTNPRMLYVPHEMAAIKDSGAHVFCIASPQHSRETKAMIIGRHLKRVVRRAARSTAPCFWRLYPSDLVRYDLR